MALSKVAIFQIFRFIFDIFITTNFIFTKILIVRVVAKSMRILTVL